MRIQKVNPTLKMAFDSSAIFGILLALIWSRYTVVTYVLQVITKLPVVGVVTPMIFPTAVILLTLSVLPWMLKRIRVEAIIFYLVSVAVILLSMILFPKNGDVIMGKLSEMLTAVLPMVFIGACYDHERHKGILFWASLLGVLAMFAYQVYQLGESDEALEYSMDAAYKTLPSIMFLIYYAFEKKKLRYCIIAVLAGIATFVFGTRGPILCMFVFLAISLLLVIGKQKRTGPKVLIIMIVGGVALLLIFGDILTSLAESLSEQFAKWGFSTRVFDYFIEGDMADDSGRSSLSEGAIASIRGNLFFGTGLMSDQVELGNYVHNLFLELWMQFGVLAGTAIALYFVGRPLSALHAQRRNADFQRFIWMLICLNFVKLMLSSTYTAEKMLFFMIGVSIAATSKNRRTYQNLESVKE